MRHILDTIKYYKEYCLWLYGCYKQPREIGTIFYKWCGLKRVRFVVVAHGLRNEEIIERC